MPLPLLALAFAIGLVALIPTRRLFNAGWSRASLTTYFVVVWLLTVLAAWGPGRSVLLPILVIAWLLPWFAPRLGTRARREPPTRRPPPKNVTPPDAR